MTWQDPMSDSQQTETRRRIKKILDVLYDALRQRGLDVTEDDANTFSVDGMTFTATDQLSDTYNNVCYLLTDYNQTIECTLSRIDECADTIEELLEVQVEKMRFSEQVAKQRVKNNSLHKSQWTDGETIYFDNEDIVVYVRAHPRLHCIDVYMQRMDRHNSKFLGRYDDTTSEWQLRTWLMEEHPELKYDDSELY